MTQFDELVEAIPSVVGTAVEGIVENADRLGLTWTLRPATVIDGGTPSSNLPAGIIMATYDGDTEPIGMVSMVGQGIPANTRVYVLRVPPSGNFIVGFTDIAVGLGLSVYNNVNTGDPASGTTTSGTYVDMPGPMEMTFRKYYFHSRIRLWMSGTWFESTGTAGTSAAFGLEVAGGSVTTTDFNMSAYRATIPAGIVRLPIIAADKIVTCPGKGLLTITARWFRSTGAGTLGVAIGTDFLSMSAEEVV